MRVNTFLPALVAALAASQAAYAFRTPCATDLTPTSPVVETTVESSVMAHVTELFPERISIYDAEHPIGSQALLESVEPFFTFLQQGYINITFIHEGAGYRNQIGYMDMDSGNTTMLFPDLSYYWPGCMETGDMVQIGPFQAGQRIGFFLKANGYNRPNYRTWYMNASLNVDGFQHHITILDNQHNSFILGIEDLHNLGDQDFNDAVLHMAVMVNPSDGSNSEPVQNVVDTSGMFEDPITECIERDDTFLSGRSDVGPTGLEYAILDGTSLWQTRMGGQSRDYRLTTTGGWDVAPADPIMRAEIPCHSWGAPCLALDDDVAVGRNLQECAAPGLQVAAGGGPEPAAGECFQPTTEGTRVVVSRHKMTGNFPSMDAEAWAYPYDPTVPFSFDAGSGVWSIDGQVGKTAGLQFVLGVAEPLTTEAQTYGVRVCAEFAATGLSGLHDYKINEPAGLYGDILYADGNWSYGIQGRTNTGTHGWEEQCIDFDTGRRATQYFYVNAIIRGRTGNMQVRNFQLRPRYGNLVENGNYLVRGDPASDGQQFYKWNAFGADGYEIGSDATYGDVVNLTAASDQEEHGVEQIMFLDDPQLPRRAKGLYLGASFWTSGVSGLSDRFIAVYADVHFADGSSELGLAVPFPTNTNSQWQYSDAARYFTTPGASDKDIARINVLGLMVNRSGTVLIKDVEVRLLECLGGGPSANAAGDPHYRSLFGVDYDLQTIGQFVAYQDPEADLAVEHSAAGAGAIATRMAFRFGGSDIELETSSGAEPPVVRVNQGTVNLADGLALPVMPRDNTTVAGPTVRRRGAAAGIENSVGIPLQYIIEADSATHANEGYLIVVSVFVSSFGTQFFTVDLQKAPASYLNVATGLFAVDSAPDEYSQDAQDAQDTAAEQAARRNSANAGMVRRQLGGPRDIWAHRTLGPMFAITDPQQSPFKVLNGQLPVDVYNQSTAERYLDAVANLNSAQAAAARNGPCAALTGIQQDQCVLDVLFMGDNGVARAFAAVPQPATEPIGSNITNPYNPNQPLPSGNPPSSNSAPAPSEVEIDSAAPRTTAALVAASTAALAAHYLF